MTCRHCATLEVAFTEGNVVELDKGELHVGGLKPSETELRQLKEEVAAIKSFRVWRLLTDTARAQAIDIGLKSAKDFDQVLFAKAMLHVVGINETIIKSIEAAKAA